ncbi:MAG TPA: ABC transporter ATP-binding protein [Phycisphaerae bacterium]|nr:ABC transporter ATP-binding protein [Phycisphaerae bacterium]HRY69861.1 ABC transporter ATP-binding protein [Phycisphaerae bacterium]HSA25412.1 ABC transporter ATP-binding protein [Phycisphaerae bacterium]
MLTATGHDNAPLASLEQIKKVYRKPGTSVEVHALRGISLTFHRGEYVAICGHSGSGKSTLMNLIGCLDRPTSGRYLLGGDDVAKLDDDTLSEIRGSRLGFVFQNFNLIPQLTILENLEVPLFYQRVPVRDRRERAMYLVERVGLSSRAHHRPMELSGGQQQRAAIARALINDPLLILADEPTGNLDTATGEIILDLFDELNSKIGKTILMVTHEPDVAARCKRVIVLRDGRILSDERQMPGRPSPGSRQPAVAH